MARLQVTPQTTTGPFPTELTALTWTTCDDVNGTEVQLTGRELFLFRGVGTVTLVSTPDATGRVLDIVKVLSSATNPTYAGPFGLSGWRQADRPVMHINTNAPGADTIEIAVLTIF